MPLFNYVTEHLPVCFFNTGYKSIKALILSILILVFAILQATSLACSLKNCGSDKAIPVSIYSGK